MQTAYGCVGTSSGMISIGVWHARTKSRDTLHSVASRVLSLLCQKREHLESYPSWASETTALKVTRSIGAWVSFLHWWRTCGGTSTPSPSETV